MIFRLFEHGKPIITRQNKQNIYASLHDAKVHLKRYLSRVNKKILDKNLQLKADDCSIIEFELIQKNKYKL